MASPALGSSGLSSQDPAGEARPLESSAVPLPPPGPGPAPELYTTIHAGRETTAPALRISLESLPNELLQPIASFLAPISTSTTRFALREDGSWAIKDATVQWNEWLMARRDVISFMQTSSRMAAICRSFLWHNILIYSPRALVSLALELERRPEVRAWVQELTCLVDIGLQRSIWATLEEWRRQTAQSVSGPGMMVPDRFAAVHLLTFIGNVSPNFRHFLAAPPDLRLEAGSEEETITSQLPGWHQSDSPLPENSTAPTPMMPWLHRLESLRIYCNRTMLKHRGGHFADFLVQNTIYNLPLFSNLSTLELCCDSLQVDLNRLEDDKLVFPPLPNIQHLRFYGSRIHEPRLVALCLACTNLQSLLVHFEESVTDEEREYLPEGTRLNDALLARAGTLTELELVALDEGHYLTRGQERPRKPENHRLRCIPSLDRLERLTIDFRGLFGTLGLLDYDDGVRLYRAMHALSRLQELTLVCEFGTRRDYKQTYLSNLDAVFYGIEQLCSDALVARAAPATPLPTDLAPVTPAATLPPPPLPPLRSITLALDHWPLKERFRKRFRRTLNNTRRQCHEVGIRFRTIDLFPSYRDEDEDGDGDAEAHENEEGAADDEEGFDGDELDEDDFDDGEGPAAAPGGPGVIILPNEEDDDDGEDEEDLELEEEDEASEYYFSGDDESDMERAARRPPTFTEFLRRMGEGHGHEISELFLAYYEDRWDEYLF